MKKLITIFTPTFNRAHTLQKLYESLCRQETFNFEWVVVDDGSKDNTINLVASWIKENRIPIIFETKVNEGKHIAINRGVELAKGDLFFIVDSDDYLALNATKLVEKYYSLIKDKDDLAGVSFRRGTDNSTFIGTPQRFEDEQLDVFNFRYTKKIEGDMAEVYKTAVLKKYPFPKFEDERFCPESLVWNRIGLNYKMLWTSHIVYICNYLVDGLTSQIYEVRKKSPIATTTYYSELEKMPIPLLSKFKANINYWRFAKFLSSSLADQWKNANSLMSILGLPISSIFIFKDNQ